MSVPKNSQYSFDDEIDGGTWTFVGSDDSLHMKMFPLYETAVFTLYDVVEDIYGFTPVVQYDPSACEYCEYACVINPSL